MAGHRPGRHRDASAQARVRSGSDRQHLPRHAGEPGGWHSAGQRQTELLQARRDLEGVNVEIPDEFPYWDTIKRIYQPNQVRHRS
eukprot:763340-Hanusia_phi.AAC.13